MWMEKVRHNRVISKDYNCSILLGLDTIVPDSTFPLFSNGVMLCPLLVPTLVFAASLTRNLFDGGPLVH
jgi:hypothetical protein